MIEPVASVERQRSLTAIVTEQIRDLIVTDALALGQRLSVHALAERLGLSHTPVREALLRLAAERLVEVRPRRGAFVFRGDAREVREICELRGILETGALRLAMRHDAGSLLGRLEQNLCDADHLNLRVAIVYQSFDQGFHDIIVDGSGNRQLIEAYARLRGRVQALRHRLISSVDHVAGAIAAHHEVTDSVAAGDVTTAEAALDRHVFSTYRALQHLFARQPAEGA